jgi:hypothetical protein
MCNFFESKNLYKSFDQECLFEWMKKFIENRMQKIVCRIFLYRLQLCESKWPTQAGKHPKYPNPTKPYEIPTTKGALSIHPEE